MGRPQVLSGGKFGWRVGHEPLFMIRNLDFISLGWVATEGFWVGNGPGMLHICFSSDLTVHSSISTEMGMLALSL